MKFVKTMLVLLVLAAAAYPQTEDLGMGAFANDKSDIMLAVDASLASASPDNTYVLFVVFMAAKSQNQNVVVSRDGVVMVYNGQEYKMPSLQEFRENYKGDIWDVTRYRKLAKEGIISSWIRFYNFPSSGDFFPALQNTSQIMTDEGSMYGNLGFWSKCYFKNPGLKKGDTIVIRVTAKNKPELKGEVAVKL
jgi:hypothetical protein